MSDKKGLAVDIIFIFYVLVILPAISFVYFAYSLTNFESIETIIGAAILWSITIPYPVYWYLKKKLSPAGNN